MMPVERVFAREFSAARQTADGRILVTPSGACCRRLFIVGALTERLGSGDLVHARVADPTGVFLVTADWHNPDALDTLRCIDPPAFVAVTGRPVFSGSGDGVCATLDVEAVRVADRGARDTWVLATAAATLDRLEALRDGGDESASILEMVRAAVETVRETPSPVGITPRTLPEVMLDALQRMGGGSRGIGVDDAVAAGVRSGLTAGEARAAIEELLADGDCYQPVDGTIKLI